VRHVPHKEHVAGVLLAAGQGTRWRAADGGGDGAKLLAPLDGQPLVRHAAAALVRAGVRELVVVTGPDPEPVTAALAGVVPAGGPMLHIVPNPDAARGLGRSVAVGIASVASSTEAAIIALGDQPRVPDAVLHGLLAAWRGTGAPIVAPRYAGGVRGNPVLFDADLFRELRKLDGDEGARSVILRSADRVRLVDFDVEMPIDVDTPEDLARL
jgi:molybdenum cofactor cytidylyltransferase